MGHILFFCLYYVVSWMLVLPVLEIEKVEIKDIIKGKILSLIFLIFPFVLVIIVLFKKWEKLYYGENDESQS